MDLKRVLEGLTVVAVGLVLLGNTTGWIPWEVWWSIASLWPLLLIAAGIDLIGRSLDNTWLRALGSLVVIGGLAYAVFVMAPAGPGQLGWLGLRVDRAGEPFYEREPHADGVFIGSATIKGGVGELDVGAGDDLVSIEGESPFGKPSLETGPGTRMRGSLVASSSIDVRVEYPDRGAPFLGLGRRSRLEVDLDREVVWSLDVDAGVSQLDVDLSELHVARLDLDMGVSSGTVKLGEPEYRSGDVAVDAGVSTMKVLVPEGVGVRLKVKEGIGNVDVGDGFRQVPDQDGRRMWESDGYDDASRKWNLTVNAGVSNIRVERY